MEDISLIVFLTEFQAVANVVLIPIIRAASTTEIATNLVVSISVMPGTPMFSNENNSSFTSY